MGMKESWTKIYDRSNGGGGGGGGELKPSFGAKSAHS